MPTGSGMDWASKSLLTSYYGSSHIEEISEEQLKILPYYINSTVIKPIISYQDILTTKKY